MTPLRSTRPDVHPSALARSPKSPPPPRVRPMQAGTTLHCVIICIASARHNSGPSHPEANLVRAHVWHSRCACTVRRPAHTCGCSGRARPRRAWHTTPTRACHVAGGACCCVRMVPAHACVVALAQTRRHMPTAPLKPSCVRLPLCACQTCGLCVAPTRRLVTRQRGRRPRHSHSD